MRRHFRLVRNVEGAEVAEFAFVLPFLVMVLLGILWFGRALNISATLNRAAREAAYAAAAPTCATCGNSFSSPATIKSNFVDPVLTAASLDPAQVQNFNVQTGVPLPGSNPVEIGTVVSLSYPYTFRLTGMTCCPVALTTLYPGITMSARAQAREEH